MVQYGEKVVHEFSLSDFRSVEDVVRAARKIEQRGGEETNTALGINEARYDQSSSVPFQCTCSSDNARLQLRVSR